MDAVRIENPESADLADLLMQDEQILWIGGPEYGKRLFQPTPNEKRVARFSLACVILMWMTIPTLLNDEASDIGIAIKTYSGLSFFLGFGFLLNARSRARRFQQTIYAVTNQKAIIWESSTTGLCRSNIKMTSCKLLTDFPYAVSEMGTMHRLHIGIKFNTVQDGKLVPLRPSFNGGLPALKTDLYFENISNADELRELIVSQLPSQVE